MNIRRTLDKFSYDFGRLAVARWQIVVLGVLIAAHVSVIGAVFLQPGRPPLRPDSAIFEYAGWSMRHGASLYTQIWEIKLPLAYETPAVLAYLSGEDILTYHVLNVVLTAGVSVGAGYLVALLVEDITHDRSAAIVAGISALLLPGYFYLPAFGFKSKFFVAFAGMSSIYLVRQRSYLMSGVFAAASVGYYQAAAIVPVTVVLLAYQRGRLRGAGEAIVGGVTLTVAMIVPVVQSGAIEAMIAEAVVVPLVVDAGGGPSVLHTLVRGGFDFGVATPVVLLGIAGFWLSLTRYDARETWWIVVGGAWFGFIVFFHDYDGFPDLIPGLMFVAIALGVLVSQISSPTRRQLVTGAVVVCILTNVVIVVVLGAIPWYQVKGAQPLSELRDVTYELDGEERYTVVRPDVRYLYWNEIAPETCHIRLSGTELRWLQQTGKPLIDRQCGDLDRALQARSLRASAEGFAQDVVRYL